MDENGYKELEEEIKGYKDRKEYAECVQRMEQLEKEVTDPDTRTIVLTAKSTCAAQMGDWATAESAISKVDLVPLSPEMRNCTNMVRGSVAHHLGQLERAESLFSGILASKEAHAEQQREILYEATARLGMLYSNQNRFRSALDLLQRAELMVPNGDLRESIGIYLGYCLQAFGRLAEAEQHLKQVLENGSGELKVDAWYRLGAVQLQAGDCEAAINSFQSALDSLPNGGISESDILLALQEARDEQNTDPADRPSAKKHAKPRVQ